MVQLLVSAVLLCTVSFGKAYPYAASVNPAIISPPVAASLAPSTYPLVPTSRPVLSGVVGYNQLAGTPDYRNSIFAGVAGYRNPLFSGAAGFNNPHYGQYRNSGVAIPILSYSNDHIGDGTYSFSFTTADGKQAQEAGFLKDAYIDNNGEPQGTQVVQGSYAYISPEGTPIQVNYVADENGFRPSGVHIPADGKAVAPIIGNKAKQILDPLYNRYDPHYRQGYSGIGAFNRPYDPRNTYEPTRYNPYLNNQYLAPSLKDAKDKKIA